MKRLNTSILIILTLMLVFIRTPLFADSPMPVSFSYADVDMMEHPLTYLFLAIPVNVYLVITSIGFPSLGEYPYFGLTMGWQFVIFIISLQEGLVDIGDELCQ